jgi:hypothetical protein
VLVGDLLWFGVDLLLSLTLTTFKSKACVDLAFFLDASLFEGLGIFKLGSSKDEANSIFADV